MSASDEGFIQKYDLGRKQQLFIYCRLCRSTFPVAFKPRSRKVKLRCLCGNEAPLKELDVFRTQKEVTEHANFYQRIYRAAKDALKDAGIPMPPSGKYRKVEDVQKDSGFTSFYSEESDASTIRDAYIEEEESEHSAPALRSKLKEFEEELEYAGDTYERHLLLSEIVEWTYCRRHFNEDVYAAFRSACRQDIGMAGDVVREAKRRKRAGEKVRLKFTSFKHLILDLEEDGEHGKALRVAEQAVALGLKNYEERARELRNRLR
jgi:hypothetical protein